MNVISKDTWKYSSVHIVTEVREIEIAVPRKRAASIVRAHAHGGTKAALLQG